ncbi:hypothetical protein O7606_01825 [Micromonospora sp. WMMD882]|uniref:hypothetical protein n=1 Tax=Micromonospora sp. WMMD882 TaxID=3015151 RepID=UPI00248C3864|nr:hypothetical protein [Micromonospora sp. WMMD882]WBB80156.1 hypothetical protein O7606_01825 [Micromonospora sp. WMMD882]
MTSVRLLLPAEVVEEADLPYEGVRDVSAVTLAVEGVAVVANLATLATLQPQLGALVAAIRNWRLRDPRPSVLLTVQGPGIDLKIDLPRNVSKAQLLDQLRPLFADED